MILFNTANRNQKSSFKNAIFQGLADQNGLFMPEELPQLPVRFFEDLPHMTFQEMAFQVLNPLIGDEIPEKELRFICNEAFNFPVPISTLKNGMFALELFHGPSLAFKDFGARFMSRTMAYFNREEKRPLHVLVATSGDTGGAVAMGFLGVEGTKVSILFPKNRVSKYQEVQLTSLGKNIQALEVEGSFDDCQSLVKQAFQDRAFSKKEGLTSANSINIARLLPQMLYYFYAWGQVKNMTRKDQVVFSVPSGNFGNICAAAFAKKMGLPIYKLVAAVNENRVFTNYLETGNFKPMPSKATLSNAMDVGNPSNFVRIETLLENWEGVKDWFSSYSFTDKETESAEIHLFEELAYLSEPHAAVGYLGLKEFLKEYPGGFAPVFLGTAHPCKFLPVLPEKLQKKVEIPELLKNLLENPSHKTSITDNYQNLVDKIKSFQV
jgi:threonine synthase